MYKSFQDLRERTGEFGRTRFRFLQSLVTEFQDSENLRDKQQILANLANFAYDPVNYDYFRQLNVVRNPHIISIAKLELFLDCLDEEDERLIEFSIAGICNLSSDLSFHESIYEGGVEQILRCLSSSSENVVASAITTMYFMLESKVSSKIFRSSAVTQAMKRYSESKRPVLKNLAFAFLDRLGQLL